MAGPGGGIIHNVRILDVLDKILDKISGLRLRNLRNLIINLNS